MDQLRLGTSYSAVEGAAIVSAKGWGHCRPSIAPRICSYRAPGRDRGVGRS